MPAQAGRLTVTGKGQEAKPAQWREAKQAQAIIRHLYEANIADISGTNMMRSIIGINDAYARLEDCQKGSQS